MKKKIKVLIVHNYYQIAGGEDYVVDNDRKLLEENGHEVVLYTRNNNELRDMSKIQKLFFPMSFIFNIKTYREITNIIRNEKIDIVHVHNTLSLISPAVYYAARKCKVPIIQTIHNFRMVCPGATFYRNGNICEDCLHKGMASAIKYKCYRGSKIQTMACVLNMQIHRLTGIYGKINYICLSEFNKQKLLTLKQICKDRVFIRPNYADTNMKIVMEEKRRNQMVFAGRLDTLKGVELLFDFWNRLGDEAPKLVVCGVGPLEEWCKKFVRENGSNIEMRGFVENQKLREVIGNSRALILPTQWYEGFPMSIVEAYSVGTPVICTNIGNAGAVVVNGVSGYKFENNNFEEFSQAIHLCHGLTYSTYELFIKKYSKDISYNTLIKIYEESSN